MSLHKQTVLQLLDREYEYNKTCSNRYLTGDGIVTGAERDAVVRWLNALRGLELGVDTHALAAKLIDRVLVSRRVQSKYARCLSLCCLYVACKVCEESEHVPTLTDYVRATAGVYSVRELTRMERVVLDSLHWKMASPTVVEFVHAMLPCDEKWSASIGDDIMQLTQQHVVSQYPSSVVAAALLSLKLPLPSLMHISHYQLDWEQFLPCRLLVESVTVGRRRVSLALPIGVAVAAGKSSPRKRHRQKSKGGDSPKVKTPLDDMCIDDISDAVHILYGYNNQVPTAA